MNQNVQPTRRNEIKLDLTQLKRDNKSVVLREQNKSFFKKLFIKSVIYLPEDNCGYETVEALGLKQNHLRRLKKRFDSIDIDGSGSIDYDELFEVMEEKRSPFTDSLFELIDADKSGRIEFCEFLSLCSTYCIYTKEDILRFCFDCFDKDGSGTIDELEYKDLCATINSPSPMFPGNYGLALNMLDSNNDGLIDFDEFIDLDRRFPLILFPAFRLQQRMQKITLGEKTWIRINEAIAEATFIENYMKSHGGMMPNIPLGQKIRGKIMHLLGRKLQVSISKIEKLKKRS